LVRIEGPSHCQDYLRRFVAVLFCMLNLTPTALKTRLSRARLQLREHQSRYFKKPNWIDLFATSLNLCAEQECT